MPQKQATFKIKGMSRDLAVSSFNPEFAYDNQNMRISTLENNTLYALINERGNVQISLPDKEGFIKNDFIGTPVGYSVIDDIAVIFTHEDSIDRIYTIKFNDEDQLLAECIYSGNLNLNIEKPLETLASYENDEIKKVYWVDGENQPRVINICAKQSERDRWNNDPDFFNFVRTLSLKEQVSIERLSTGGIFAVGTIQYSFTYFNSYNQESCIFYTTPIQYCSTDEKGISPEGKAGCCFKLHLDNLESDKFEYVRIYAIQRSNKDSTPDVRKVIDLNISNITSIDYIDTGEHGSVIDYNTLFYLGGESIIAETMAQKDNTLFLGNIKLNNKYFNSEIKQWVKDCGDSLHFNNYNDDRYTSPGAEGYYPYINNLKLGSNNIKTFKYLEWYRFGIQFQFNNGKWSEVLYIKDLKNLIHQNTQIYAENNTGPATNSTKLVYAEYTLQDINTNTIKTLVDKYEVKRVRPVIVYPSINDRECICQGVLNPTMYNVEDRLNNTPFAMSSYYFRPNAPYQIPSYHWNGKFNYTWSPSIIDGSSAETIWSKNAIVDGYINYKEGLSTVKYGAPLEFRHNRGIPFNGNRNAEIQCINMYFGDYDYNSNHFNEQLCNPEPTITCDFNPILNFESSRNKWVAEYNNKNNYFVDQSIITLHSPDIEFDTNVQLLDTKGFSLRIVGAVPITSNVGDIDIQLKTRPREDNVYTGFYKEQIRAITDIKNIGESWFAWRSLCSGVYYFDKLLYAYDETNGPAGYVVYPWHRTTALNSNKDELDANGSGQYNSKRISNLRVSLNSMFYNPIHIWSNKEGETRDDFISDIKFFTSDDITALKLKCPKFKKDKQDILYYGNYDKVLEVSDAYKYTSLEHKTTNYGYAFIVANGSGDKKTSYANSRSYFHGNYTDMAAGPEGVIPKIENYGTNDPVRIKFKSTPHGVIVLNDLVTSGHYTQRVLPTIGSINEVDQIDLDPSHINNYSHHLFWDDIYTGIYQESLPSCIDGFVNGADDLRCGWLWLGELYRPDTPELQKTRFGGNTEEAIENNIWYAAGEPISLTDNNVPLTSVTIRWTEGDTYYQRYDHIKTYPFTLEDQQSMVDILSFMCETRINLDGRYDNNRGLSTNLHITPENFNKLNTAYTQDNNLFTYRTINENKISINHFPNTVVWTKTKALGELIDNWTNISMASVMDLDGDKGDITAIRRLNDKLIAFQDTGICQILYNEKEQLATTEGQAVELSNSGKVSGKRYITTNKGCINKWSIQEGSDFLYFVDDISKSMMTFTGEGLIDISTKLGMKSWFNDQCNISTWNPIQASNFVSYYDKTRNDLYYINKNWALSYNDKLGQYTSFYSYEDTPYIFNLKNKVLAIHTSPASNNYGLWEMFKGEYNKFYDISKPFYTTVIVNAEPTMDKIYNTVEYRASVYSPDNILKDIPNEIPFDTLKVENEYQLGTISLEDIKDRPSSLKKKFRIWRANIPRDTSTFKKGVKLKGDRIRNPWVYLTLGMGTENNSNIKNTRNVLQEMIVHYFI